MGLCSYDGCICMFCDNIIMLVGHFLAYLEVSCFWIVVNTVLVLIKSENSLGISFLC